MKVKIDLASAHFFNIFAGMRTDPFYHLSVFPENNCPMGCFFTYDGCGNPHKIPVIFVDGVISKALIELHDLDGCSVRDLLVRVTKDLFSAELCGECPFRLVCNFFIREKSGPRRQPSGNFIEQLFDTVAGAGRNGDNGFKLI